MIPTFDEFINPISPDVFFSEKFGRTPVHLRGKPSKFHFLPTVEEISTVLARLVIPPNIVRLKRHDGWVPSDEVLIPLANSTWGALRAEALEAHLASGATLVWETCDSWLESASDMCSVLSRAIGARVYAGLFLVALPQQPSRLHWDNRDIFICQLAGAKRWPLYRPVYENPINSHQRRGLKWEPSDLELVDEVTLTSGDALYLPRGWLHNPAATEGPSMHISFTVASPTGADLLEWVCEDLKRESATVRADLPRVFSSKEKDEFTATLRALVVEKLSTRSIEGYYDKYRSELHQPRPALGNRRATETTYSLT